MRRRNRTLPVVTLVALVAGVLAAIGPSLTQAGGSQVPTLSTWTLHAPLETVSVHATRYGRRLPKSFIGLSVEDWALPDYLGPDPHKINPLFVKLVEGMAPGGRVAVRIGGNSQDRSWVPVAGMARPAGVWYSITKSWLADAHAFERATHARVTLGINLASDSPTLSAYEARALVSAIGRSNVAALEVGNEPDLYYRASWYEHQSVAGLPPRSASYGPSQYIADADVWASVLPDLPLAGPAVGGGAWLPNTKELASDIPRLGMFTAHRYPLWGCEPNPQSSIYPTIAHLFAPGASAGLADQFAGSITRAHALGETFRLDELGSVSCSGRAGVSNTFASALWGVDVLFNLARVGADGVNFHTLPGAVYQPFTFHHSQSGWTAHVSPDYYGTLLFNRAFPPGAQLVRTTAPAGPLKVWTTVGRSGKLRVVLINESGTAARNIQLNLPGSPGALSEQVLKAAGLRATSGVSLGGESFAASTSTGTLGAPKTVLIEPSDDGYEVSVPASCAVLLTGTGSGS